MAQDELIEKGQIEVSKKTLLHISEGIYRTEGSALKELINNSFDAYAKKVIVSTNYPQFDILTVQDDGKGMTETEFLRIVKGGIGDSPKASKLQEGRPVIGRLGIGILAVAQICRSFTIISHHEETKSAFKGKMVFRTDVDQVAKEGEKESYDIGVWHLEERMDYDASKKGVLIFTKDLRQSFLKRFRDSLAVGEHPRNTTSIKFDKLITAFYEESNRTVKEQGPYFELIWELCNLLPLPYHKDSLVRAEALKTMEFFNLGKENLRYPDAYEFLKQKNNELKSYNFEVIFDDINLQRPIRLPYPIYNRDDKVQQTQLFYFEYNNKVRKRKLEFYGYFFAQEQAIKPRDLKGIQIRIKNVGIGPHDATLLKYDKIEAPRDNWLSGEIYVESGLESALNIDRDSFNENDEHYFILRQEVHGFLSETVFPTISSYQRKRNKIKRDLALRESLAELKARFEETFLKYFKGYKIDYVDETLIQIDPKKKKLYIPIAFVSNKGNRLDLFSQNAIVLLDFLRATIKKKNEIEIAFKDLSTVLLG